MVAHSRGYEAIHVNHYGLHESKDWDILKIIKDEDWVLATNNAIECRNRFMQLELHPGIVCLLSSVPRAKQIELFSAALDEIALFPDMVNVGIDVAYHDSLIRVTRYPLP
jgi:predicted nuclease of predicted toxin-antitoxin system